MLEMAKSGTCGKKYCILACFQGSLDGNLDAFKSNVQDQYMIVYDKRRLMRMRETANISCMHSTQQLHPMSHQPFAAPSGQQRRFSWKALVLSMTALQGVASSWY